MIYSEDFFKKIEESIELSEEYKEFYRKIHKKQEIAERKARINWIIRSLIILISILFITKNIAFAIGCSLSFTYMFYIFYLTEREIEYEEFSGKIAKDRLYENPDISKYYKKREVNKDDND